MRVKSELRAGLAAFGLLLAASLAVYWPYLVHNDQLIGPRSGLGSDISYRHWPDLIYYASVLRSEGVIPLWDDSVAGGRPLAGDPGVLWLYPLDLIFLLLPPAPAFNWLNVLHLWIGGAGAYLFLRKGLRLSYPAALLGSCACLLNPKIVAHLAGGHVGLICAVAWIPWALLGTARAAKGEWQGSLLAAAALALQMPGHIQIPFYTAWLMVAFAAWQLLSGAGLRQVRRRQLLALAAIIPGFLAFSAALLFPLLELLQYSSRLSFSLPDAAWYSLPPALLATLFSLSNFQFPEWVLYPGAVPLLLAGLAVVEYGRPYFGPRRRAVHFWLFVAVFALLYALGTATPLFPLIHRLPGFAQLRVPPRLWFFGSLALGVLAAYGLDAILSRRLPESCTHDRSRVPHDHFLRARRPLLALALVVYGAEATAFLAIPWLLKTPVWYLAGTLAVSLTALGLLAWFTRGRLPESGTRDRFLAAALIGLNLVELIVIARSFLLPLPVSQLVTPPPALQYLIEQPGLWRVYSTHGQLSYAAASQAGVEAAEGLLALQMGHYVELIKLASGCRAAGYGTGVPPCLTGEAGLQARNSAQPNPALLGLLNVKYVLTPLELPGPDLLPVFSAASVRGDTTRVYANTRWLPRAFIVHQVKQLPDQTSVLAALPQIDPSQTALLAGTAELPASFSSGSPVYQAAQVTARSANTLTVSASLDQPGLLVVSRTWMPGWRAWIDGAPAKVERVDYALQGVFLPFGTHVVRFAYQPAGWRIGWPISAAAWLLAAGIILLKFFRYLRRGV